MFLWIYVIGFAISTFIGTSVILAPKYLDSGEFASLWSEGPNPFSLSCSSIFKEICRPKPIHSRLNITGVFWVAKSKIIEFFYIRCQAYHRSIIST